MLLFLIIDSTSEKFIILVNESLRLSFERTSTILVISCASKDFRTALMYTITRFLHY